MYFQPINDTELTQFINNQITTNNTISINQLCEEILKLLKGKSSKFKYIINSNIFSIIDYSDNNKINSSFNALWDNENDGLFNIQFPLNDNQILLTIIFISL